MKPTGFFTLHIDDPEQTSPPIAGASASSGGVAEVGEAGNGYRVRLGWMQGEPYLIDQGSAGRVLVNGAPIEPDRRVAIRPGDKISIGKAHLTWSVGAETDQPEEEPEGVQAPKVTVVLPREPGVSATESDDQAPAVSQGLSKPVAEQIAPETPTPSVIEPKSAAEPAIAVPPDATILMSRVTASPPTSEAPDGVTAAPGEAAQEPAETGTYRTAWIDMAQVLEQDIDLEFESTTILRDTRIPHLVFHLPNRTWEVQLSKESLTIGRGKKNDVLLPDESVSERHARLERRGSDYLIRDAGSRNGLWLGKQRIEEHKLRDGDVLSLGRARLVFKGGFTSDDLTLIGPPRIDGKPARRPVVFVPGLMGTELWIGSERLWPNPRTILSNPEIFALPGDPRIEPRGIVNDVVIVPRLIESRQYSALGDYLVTGLGYTRGKDLLEFGYDWRQDVRLAAQGLAEAIEGWRVKAPLTIIAHSLGTLVTRYYVERLGGKRCVERIILMGGPHHGTPKGLAAILLGPGMLPFGMADERLRAVLATLPSAYQILPTYPCVVDQHGDCIELLEDESWLPEQQRRFLRTARGFRRELGTVSSVPAVSIFGYGLKTKLRATIDRGPDGQWQRVEFTEEAAGDQSVPSGSAVLKDSEIHPVLQEHGSLYVDDDVRMRLKVELTRSTTWQRNK
jgi:pSer/pThr/pTyr-binding forkhead associated (FHA) protein